ARGHAHCAPAEAAVQEALLAAAVQWPPQGRPANSRAWLITAASRRLTDQLRADDARQRYEASAAALVPPDEFIAPAADEEQPAERDDTLRLLFLCCHPALSPPSQVTIALRADGGVTASE